MPAAVDGGDLDAPLAPRVGRDPTVLRESRTAELLAESCRWEYEGLPYWGGEVDCCTNAWMLGNGLWLGADVDGLVDRFLEHRLPDGVPSRIRLMRQQPEVGPRDVRWGAGNGVCKACRVQELRGPRQMDDGRRCIVRASEAPATRCSVEGGNVPRQLIILLCLLSSVLGGCAGVDPAAGPDVQHSATPFELYTHCGIHELKTDDGRFFERADGPLTDGSGNPPPGWGNPSQSGQLVVSDDVAVFTDELGHREEFRVREGATDFLQICA